MAKSIVKLSEAPPGTYKRIGRNTRTKRPMAQEEAKRIVDEARRRILLADEGEGPLPK